MSAACIVALRGASVAYGSQLVLREVSLCLVPGEVVALVGGSGSGKTTLLRLMLGLQRPLQGSVELFGRLLHGPERADPMASELRERCGVVFQGGALFSALSVFDNVALPLRELRSIPEAVVERLVLRKLALVGLEPRTAEKMPAELSGGMVKRVALARALVLDPELLFLDEPTSGLDPQLSHEFMLHLDALRRDLALSVVMVTHDVRTVLALADRVGVVADQQLVTLAPVPEVVRHAHPFVRSFFAGEERLHEPAALAAYREEFRQEHRPARE